jgi:hypothetical protein
MSFDTTYVKPLSKNSYVTIPIDLERYFAVSEVPDIINFRSFVGTRTKLTVWVV